MNDKEFESYRYKNAVRDFTFAIPFAVSLFLSFICLDVLLQQNHLKEIIITRVSTSVICLLLVPIVIIYKSKLGLVKIIQVITIVLVSIYSAVITFYSGGFDSTYWAGFMFVIVGYCTCFPQTYKSSIVISVIIILVYNSILFLLLFPVLIKNSLTNIIQYNIFLFGSVIVGVVGSYTIQRNKYLSFIANKNLEKEKNRSEGLLLNILPVSIANRLKSGETTISDYFEEVAILFSDIVGFTKFSSDRKSKEIVELLNDIFTAFDIKTEELRIEKIKTIGDGYMAMAGGLKKDENNLLKIIELGDYMIQFIEKYSKEKNLELKIRIGIHIGSVTAGVIGKTKFSFDIWGDTVNIASRMESAGIPMEIHITENVALKLKDMDRCVPRGEIEVKGKGKMKTYIVRRYDRILT